MPVQKTITKEIIFNNAFELIREQGIENLSARNIAKKIGCSTQPIYSSYNNMDELAGELIIKTQQYVIDKYLDTPETEKKFFNIGAGYVKMAYYEPHLFNILFFKFKEIDESNFLNNEFNTFLYDNMQKDDHVQGLHEDAKKRLFLNMHIYCHGLATSIMNQPERYNEEEAMSLIANMGKIVIEWEINNQSGTIRHLEDICDNCR